MKELEVLRRRFESHTPRLIGAEQEYAVLCPLLECPSGLHLVFEVRAASIRQGGEVCFPGGRMEGKETAVECALRETEEELSLPRTEVTVLGLSDFICNQRGFWIHPVLGLISLKGFRSLRPAPQEVAEVFTVPFSFFRQTPPVLYSYDLVPKPPEDFPYEAIGVSRRYPWAPGKVEVPVWYWEGHAVWGLTARIIRSLL